MAWDLEHQEQVGVEERGGGNPGRKGRSGVKKKSLLYAELVLVPLLLFGLMLLLAKR